MAQTERATSTINTLLSDNTEQEISPQDLRDALASLMGYGGLLLTAGSSDVINGVGTSYSLIDVFDTIAAQSISVNEDGVAVELAPGYKLTPGATGVYMVGFYASFSSSALNKLATFRLYKNGSPDSIEADRFIATIGDTGAIAANGLISLAAGDELDLRVKINTGTTNLTFLAAALSVHRVG